MPTSSCRVSALALLVALQTSACTVAPLPLTETEIKETAQLRLTRFAEARTPVTGPLTLDNAIERAVRYNIDHRVEQVETALRSAELDVANAAALPGLVAGAGYSNRDRASASSSYNLVTNTQNFGYSTSQDLHLRTADLAFSWNVLDFGLSYVRARQAADKVLIANENRRRVVQKLVEEVRTAYWRAYTADTMHKRLKHLERRTMAALSSAKAQAADRTTSPVAAITYRRELIEIRRTLQELQRELSSAKIQLASLINETPGSNFRLMRPSTTSGKVPGPGTMQSLLALAMEKRPELHEVSYRKRINSQELDAAMLELMPGIQLFAGPNIDSNSYLLNGHWLSWGAKASWNVMRLFQLPAKRTVIETQDALLADRDLALTMAIATQIQVSRARIAVIEREWLTARAYADTQGDLLGHIRAEFKADKVSEQTLLREELNDAVATIRLHLAEASLQSARASLLTAVGMDPPGLPAEYNVDRTVDLKSSSVIRLADASDHRHTE